MVGFPDVEDSFASVCVGIDLALRWTQGLPKISETMSPLKLMTMNAFWTRVGALPLVMATVTITGATAQVADTPATRLSPIDAPSAVERYRPGPSEMSQRLRDTAYQSATDSSWGVPVRHVAWQQSQPFGAPALPGGGGYQLPPSDTAPLAAPSLPPSSGVPLPSGTLPSPPIVSGPSILQGRSLPSSPIGLQPIRSSSDMTPLAPPQLGGEYATVGNCCCVSGPSTYRAASAGVCGPSLTYDVPQAYLPPPSEIPVPAVLPPTFVAPGASAAPIRPLLSFGQQYKPVELGRGIVGQPVAYVPGEPIRNFVRYIFP
jgi:hypothetical protein